MECLKTNTFKVVGRLTDQNLKTGNKKSDGSGYISGTVTVVANIDGKDNEFEVMFYAGQSTKDGKESQLYTSYSKLGELVGKKVEITGDIRENRYWNKKNNQMSSSQQLSGRFVRGVAESTKDEGSFELGGFVVDALKERTNKEGAIYRYDFTLGQSNYNDTNMSRFIVHVEPSDISVVRGLQAYTIGQTVRVYGDLRFFVSTSTVERANEGGFGTPIVRTYVNKQHNFFVTGGTAPITKADMGCYPSDVIRNLVSAYKARDVELSEAAKSNAPAHEAVEEEPRITSKQTSLI